MADFTAIPLRTVFLSHGFQQTDRALVAHIESLLRSHGLIVINGRSLGGRPVTPALGERVEDCDALVALLTHRENEAPGVTHPWVRDEFLLARNQKRIRAIGVYERGISELEFDKGYEQIAYEPGDPLPAFVRLSETLHEWRRSAGRFLRIMVMPKEIAQKAGARADEVRCEVRFQQPKGVETDWFAARVREHTDGVYVDLHVPDEVERVQIRLDHPRAETAFSALWPAVQFKRRR